MLSKAQRVLQPLKGWFASFGTQSPEERRRIYMSGGTAFIALALFGFSVVDLIEGRVDEAARSFGVVFVLALLAVLAPRLSDPKIFARIPFFASLSMVSYETAIGANDGFTFLWFYLLPVGLFSVLGRFEGTIWFLATAAMILWLLAVVDRQTTPDGDLVNIALATFVLLGILGYGLESARFRLSEMLKAEKVELKKGITDLEALYGLVPICTSCKSVRDDRGYWHDIETYLSQHSAVELRAAFCPSCDDGAQIDVPERDIAEQLEGLESPGQRLTARETEQDRRRRIFFSAGLGVLIPFVAYFAGIDVRAGRWLEAGLIYGLTLLFIGALLVLRTGRFDRIVYQVVAGTSLLVMAYELYVGAYGGYSVLWLYSFPAFAIFSLGTCGLLWSVSAFGVSTFYLLLPIGYSYPLAMSSRFLTIYALITMMTYAIEATRRRSHDRLAQESNALRETLDEIRTLRGLLPMCPSCKKVRDDDGFWEQIEVRVTRVFGTRFSHGLCPSCGSKMFAEIGLPDAT